MQLKLVKPAPLLNTPEFQHVFSGESPKTEHFECVSLPGMVFEVKRVLGHVAEIHWPFYSHTPLFVDKRFGAIGHFTPPPPKPLPPASVLLERMERRIGAPYVWGGNWAEGAPEMLELYPPTHALSPRALELWTLRGLDCSGLLFEASEGTTPRNTSQLISFGRPVPRQEALGGWKPLDMIVYPGHVLFVRDAKTVIESKSLFGVRVCKIQDRLDELLAERMWVDVWSDKLDPSQAFMVRRFC